MSASTTNTWRMLLKKLLQDGAPTAPRGRTTSELLYCLTMVHMSEPVVACPLRRLGYKFLCAEAAWILSGDNRVSTIAPFARHIRDFSDDGLTYFGSYGTKFVEQVSYVVDTLYEDRDSRQAVITLWRERPRKTKDVPCTVSLQWLIRRDCLHCIVTMRSSDAWLGWPYDVHNFSEMSAYVLLALRWRAKNQPVDNTGDYVLPDRRHLLDVKLGNLFLNAGSQHLYSIDAERSARCVEDGTTLFNLTPFNPEEFNHPDELVRHLWAKARGERTEKLWLRELPL